MKKRIIPIALEKERSALPSPLAKERPLSALPIKGTAHITKKAYVRSFGCQMNEYDAQKMLEVLADQSDYLPTESMEDADLILLNTCSVREKAQSKVFDELGRIHLLKKAKPELLIGVGGCVASQEGSAIIKRAPYVDVVFGPQTLHRLPQMIAKRRDSGKAQVDISFPEIEKFDHLPHPQLPLRSVERQVSAFVSIMEGCSKYCTYCVVPYTRGEEFSRPLTDVLTECAILARQGVREITLLGQNVNAWRGQMEDGTALDFADLLSALHDLPEIVRWRYTTSHPLELTPSLITAHSHLPKLAAHLHLPVQSGSDRILQLMRRGYTQAQYRALVDELRAEVPALSLSSDFIVGFPGEREEDFQATLDLVRFANFDASFSFIYSARPGTPASSLPDEVDDETKHDRLHRLQALLNTQAQQIAQSRVGTVQEVLIEGVSRRSDEELMGRCADNRIVNFSAPVSYHHSLIGTMANVFITHAHPHSLRGMLRD